MCREMCENVPGGSDVPDTKGATAQILGMKKTDGKLASVLQSCSAYQISTRGFSITGNPCICLPLVERESARQPLGEVRHVSSLHSLEGA